jgi:hypothetical protein
MHLLKVSLFSAALVFSGQQVIAQETAHDELESAETYTLDSAPAQLSFTLQCTFEKECLEDEVCNDTTFAPVLKARAGGLTETDMVVEAELVSEAGDATLLGVRSNGAMSLSGGTFEARHLLTIAANGTARYTLHLSDGPMVISYLGSCT